MVERFGALDVSMYEKMNLGKHFLADYNKKLPYNIALEILAIIKVVKRLGHG